LDAELRQAILQRYPRLDPDECFVVPITFEDANNVKLERRGLAPVFVALEPIENTPYSIGVFVPEVVDKTRKPYIFVKVNHE